MLPSVQAAATMKIAEKRSQRLVPANSLLSQVMFAFPCATFKLKHDMFPQKQSFARSPKNWKWPTARLKESILIFDRLLKGDSCSRPGDIPHGKWKCRMQEEQIPDPDLTYILPLATNTFKGKTF